MPAIILKIGSQDLSDIAEQEQVTINTSPVYGKSFTNVLGQVRKQCLGVKIDISASFHVRTQRDAESIVNACDSNSVTVSYLDPRARSAVFDRPSVSVSPIFEDENEVLYYNVSVSMSCPLLGYGL